MWHLVADLNLRHDLLLPVPMHLDDGFDLLGRLYDKSLFLLDIPHLSFENTGDRTLVKVGLEVAPAIGRIQGDVGE